MKTNQKSTGHLFAIVTIIIWGTTFISTKILLADFTPIEILFIRFVIGFLVLLLLYPKRLVIEDRRQEYLFLAAGFSGITLYYLFENIALTLTTASNVGIIITIAPFFTAILSSWFLKAEKPRLPFYLGFIIAVAGIILISYNGTSLQLNPAGDLLAVLAAIAWAVYSILTRKISDLGYHTIQTTRRIFLYGLVLMIPMLFLLDFDLELSAFSKLSNLGNILFLGFGASALCFVTWNTAVRYLGAIKTSVYIYLVPVVTLATSVIVLHEPLSLKLVVGASLTLIGLGISESKFLNKQSLQKNTATQKE